MIKINLRSVYLILLFIVFLGYCNIIRNTPQKNSVKQIISTNVKGEGIGLEVEFIKGEEHNFPLMAVWIEDTAGNYIQTLYVAKSIAKGVFDYGEADKGKWKPGEIKRPAALPYWAHKRGVVSDDSLFVPTPDNPVPDAYTSETPTEDFLLKTKADNDLPHVFNVLFEINQSWDWNEYWTNNRFPGNKEYKTSCQPALVYKATVDKRSDKNQYIMEPIGHSHYAGETGELFNDLTTLTTALEIADKIIVKVKK